MFFNNIFSYKLNIYINIIIKINNIKTTLLLKLPKNRINKSFKEKQSFEAALNFTVRSSNYS